MKNSDSGFFVTLCLMLLMLVTSWPSFWSSNFRSSRSTEWWILRSTNRNGLSCLSWYVWKLAFRVFNSFVNFLYASGLAGRTFTLLLLIFNLYSFLSIAFWIVFVIDWMSMTSSMKIGGGGVFLCRLCIYFCGCIHSDFSLQYREPVVGGYLAGWRVGLPFVDIGPASFEFAFFRKRIVCKERCIAPLSRGRKSGVVVTKLRRIGLVWLGHRRSS